MIYDFVVQVFQIHIIHIYISLISDYDILANLNLKLSWVLPIPKATPYR